jgi:hypothetical protein
MRDQGWYNQNRRGNSGIERAQNSYKGTQHGNTLPPSSYTGSKTLDKRVEKLRELIVSKDERHKVQVKENFSDDISQHKDSQQKMSSSKSLFKLEQSKHMSGVPPENSISQNEIGLSDEVIESSIKTVTLKKHAETAVEPPNKVLKISTKSKTEVERGKEARWKDEYDESEASENEVYQIEESKITEINEAEELVSTSNINVNNTRNTLENNVNHLLSGIEPFCVYKKVNNEQKLLYTQSNINFTCFSFFGANHQSIGFLEEYKSETLKQLRTYFTQNHDNIWYASSFMHLFQKKDDEGSLFTKNTAHLLPKLTLNFHTKNGPKKYMPHSNQLIYKTMSEDKCPLIKTLRKEIQVLVNYKFNNVACILYPLWLSYIKTHRDESQLSGLAVSDGTEGNEFIVTVSLLGDKMLLLTDWTTEEKFYVLHRQDSVYFMKGCQKMSTHEKLASKLPYSKYAKFWPFLKNCKTKSHISIVFRRLEHIQINVEKAMYLPVQVA